MKAALKIIGLGALIALPIAGGEISLRLALGLAIAVAIAVVLAAFGAA